MRRVRTIAVLALPLAAACSVLVQPADDRVRCVVNGGVDPCPAGQRCLDGVCTTVPDAGTECMDQEMGCNDRDDDCDGTVDEGSDVDGDGFEWCASEPTQRDCRDDNPDIHPGGATTPPPMDVPCDGVDNDCSGSAAECMLGQLCHPDGACRAPNCSFGDTCDPGERCNLDLDPPDCEAATTDCTVTGCTAGPATICDPITLECIVPRQAGQPCNVDAQCAPGLACFDVAALQLRASDVAGATQVCSRACCTDADCGSGNSCWASGSGARGCVPTSMLAGGPSGAPGDSACGRQNQCGGQTCAVRSSPAYDDPGRRAFTCGSAIGSATGACDSSSECVSGLCVQACVGFLCDNFCSSPCGRSADCGFEDYCGYVRTGSGDVLQSCIFREGLGDGEQGAACGDSSDCRTLACLPGASGGYCADTCCTDADCGSYVCRPRLLEGFWAMLCQEP